MNQKQPHNFPQHSQDLHIVSWKFWMTAALTLEWRWTQTSLRYDTLTYLPLHFSAEGMDVRGTLVLILRKMPEGSYKTLKIYLLANNTSSRFTMTRFNLQWTSNCLPHFWLAFFNIKYRDIYKRHLNASFFPKSHIIHSSLIWLGIAAPEEFSRPSRKSHANRRQQFHDL